MIRGGVYAALSCLALLATWVPATPDSWAVLSGDEYISGKPWYIRISAPASWKMSEQSSYTSLCVRAASNATDAGDRGAASGDATSTKTGGGAGTGGNAPDAARPADSGSEAARPDDAVPGDRECTRTDDNGARATMLLWMYRRNPAGKMILAAERLEPEPDGARLTSRTYAEKSRKLLAELGFEVRTPQLHAATGAYWIEFNNGASFMRQAVLVAGDVGFSLTLAASDERTRTRHVRAFDYALRSIRLDRAESPDTGGRTGGEAR